MSFHRSTICHLCHVWLEAAWSGSFAFAICGYVTRQGTLISFRRPQRNEHPISVGMLARNLSILPELLVKVCQRPL